jgi:RNA exonuclease 4
LLSSLLYGLTVSPLSPAKTFEEVQGGVAELMKDRILIGHAVQNDLKVRFALFLLAHGTQNLAPQALMLSHPRAQLRDTQILAHRHGQSRSARPALRNLVHDMLGAKIQEGEHSSVRRNISPVSEAFTELDDR